jgi:hypothetical protein
MNPDDQLPQAPPVPVPPQPIETPETKPLGKADKFKRSFFQILIGCLLGAASIAVIAVLVGSFNDVLGRALATIGVVALHASLGFSYISETEKRNKKDGGRSVEVFGDAVFVLVIFSFITSVFAIWQLLDGGIAIKLYMLYGVLLFATLHADVLYRIRRFTKNIDAVVSANYFFMLLVVLMLSLVIFSDASGLGEMFYRILAAAGIVDATLSITAIIMHKLHLQKHPELATGQEASAQSKSFLRNPLVVLLLIFLLFQVVGSFIGLLVRGF